MENQFYLFDKLSLLFYSKPKKDEVILSKLLEDINTFDFSSIKVNEGQERITLAVNQICNLVSTTDKLLVHKSLLLFETFLSHLKITVEGKTLSVVVTWCLNCLQENDPKLIFKSLTVLQLLIRNNCQQIENLIDRIIATCLDLMKKWTQEDPPNIYFSALKCVEALSVSSEQLPDSIEEKCLLVYLAVLYNEPDLSDPIWQAKCFISAITGLTNIVEQFSERTTEILPEIIGVVKGFMLHGIPGQDGYRIEKAVPTNISLPEQLKPSQPIKKAKGKYDKKSKKKNITPIADVNKEDDITSYTGAMESVIFVNNLTTSDSDYSDSETAFSGKLRSVQTKVRLCALILLGTLLQKGDVKSLTRFVLVLLSDGSPIPCTRTLSVCLLKEPSPKCRSECLIVLSTILSKFKTFWLLADNLSRSSFTTFSTTIGNTLKELHRVLTLALIAENSNTVITHTLKTISDLVRSTPYHKLETGSLTDLVKHVKSFINCKDINVQICVWTVLGCVSSIDPSTEESKQLILEDVDNGKPWLFKKSLAVLMTDGINTALAIECFQVMGALVRNYFLETVFAFPEDIIQLLGLCSRAEYSVRLYSAKFCETLTQNLQAKVGTEGASMRTLIPLSTRLWNAMIPGSVSVLLQSDAAGLRATGCECIANIGIQTYDSQCSLIFDELPRNNQIVCITHLFGCAKDEVPAVRAASIRGLAVFVLFSSLRQDPLFFMDTVDAFLVASKDVDISVRSQSAWLYGNLTNAALLNIEEGVEDDLENSVLSNLLKAGANLALDSFKVRPNAIRGLGNLLKLIVASSFAKCREEILAAVDAVVKNAECATFMKARWNACYALGNALSNTVLCSDSRPKALPLLMNLVQNYKNFKVRISASHAISSVCDRSGFHDYYIPTWSAMVAALENTANIADMNEYQHRDQLIDQICLTMYRLICLMSLTDIVAVHSVVIHSVNSLQCHLRRFKDRVVPEKSTVIVDAEDRLRELAGEDLSSEQMKVVSDLVDLFVTNNTYE